MVRSTSTWRVPALVLVIWAFLVLLHLVLVGETSEEQSLCLFKSTTGLPCATCGSTRMVVAASKGHWVESFLLNPLMFLLMVVIAVLLVVRLLFGLDLWGRLTAVGQQRIWIAAGVLLLINWGYLVSVGR